MKHFALILAISFTPAPASADFFDLFEDFTDESQQFMEKWAEKFGPSLEALGPKLDALMDKVDDWTNYELPEVLPNGDIIIRRKAPTPDSAPQDQNQQKPGIEL